MKMYKILLTLLLATMLNAAIYDGIAVVVDDKAITLLDIEKAMQETHLDAKKVTDILIRKKLEEIEIRQRHITVTNSEVYDDIKKIAARNHLTIGRFYDAVRESEGLSSSALKKKIKEQLLTQKLYQAIAMNAMSQPSDEEIKEFYELHKKEFDHPSAFDVIIYNAPQKSLLEEKVHNPMFYSPQISSHEQTLEYGKISPELASLLLKTPLDTFTAVLPNGQGGFMSFYLKSVASSKKENLQTVRPQIINAILEQKRQQILSDYFARLRDNADINIIRMPE